MNWITILQLWGTTNTDLINSNKDLVSEKSTLISKHEMAVERMNSLNSELSNYKSVDKKWWLNSMLSSWNTTHWWIPKQNLPTTFKYSSNNARNLQWKWKKPNWRSITSKMIFLKPEICCKERTRESSTIRKLLLDAEEQSNIKAAELKNEIRNITEEKNEVESNLHTALKKKSKGKVKSLKRLPKDMHSR